MAALPREAGFASILFHQVASQSSDKCSHTSMYAENNDFLDLSRHSPPFVEGRRRIGLQLAEHLDLKKIRSKVPLASGTLEPDMRF